MSEFPHLPIARSLRDGGSTQISSRLGTSSGATDSTEESKNQCIVHQNNHQEKTPKKMIRRPTLNKRISRSMTNDINKLGRTTSRAQKISSRTTSNTNLLMIPDRFAGMRKNFRNNVHNAGNNRRGQFSIPNSSNTTPRKLRRNEIGENSMIILEHQEKSLPGSDELIESIVSQDDSQMS